MTKEAFINYVNSGNFFTLEEVKDAFPDINFAPEGEFINSKYIYEPNINTLATDVYELDDGFVGVKGRVTAPKTIDKDKKCKAFSMEQKEIHYYKYVKEK